MESGYQNIQTGIELPSSWIFKDFYILASSGQNMETAKRQISQRKSAV
jgi:hypothetical protein